MANWMSADEVQGRLGVKLQTLYAYVSRGQITARADAADPRRSVYAFADVERLALRQRHGRRATVAREAMSFGEPVLSSAITTIADGRLYYRGRDAVSLSNQSSLETTACLLWGCGEDDPFAGLACQPLAVSGPDGRARAFAHFAQRAATDPAIAGRAEPALRREGAVLMSSLVNAVCGSGGGGLLHDRLARAWRIEGGRVDVLRRCLVLCADHELNASAFAARVAASTGASLAAGALAGLSTLSGPSHGGMTAQVTALVAEARRAPSFKGAVAQRLAQGLSIPGFGHPLYRGGDPRADAIRTAAPWSPEMQAIASACEDATGARPNLDFALVAMARSLNLPSDAPFMLFALGRTAGWIAHMLEQHASGSGVIRPRARYTGPLPDGTVAALHLGRDAA